MSKLLDFLNSIEPDKKKSPFLHTLYDGIHTFLYTPNAVTSPKGVQIRDKIDLKRTMVQVVIALQLCYIFGMWNIGHQHFIALGDHTEIFDAFLPKIFYGVGKILPIFIVTHIVGLGIEFFYASKRGHAIEEGYLVSGALIPLIMPPDINLWILAQAVAFGVIIGKEAFGGTGMNIWNVALLTRVYIFFAYPTTISGEDCWIAGFDSIAPGIQASYGWWESFGNWIFGANTFDSARTIIDGFTGATPLGLAAKGGWEAVNQVYTPEQMWWGGIPGSVGETCKPFILIGALMLLITGIGSWRIMLSMFLGAVITALTFNAVSDTGLTGIPWIYHFYMGSFFFAMAFMATDPVTAAGTNTGKLIYGFFIGMIGMIIRVLNPAYPEGWMLAILFMNMFAPLIDHMIIQSNISKRQNRAKYI